jgi:arylsulfatase A-like enzyme
MPRPTPSRSSFSRHALLRGGAALAVASAARPAWPAAPTERPSFVFILADDLGYADLSVYGQTDYQTPHLDRLAGEGIRLTHAYANSPVCSPTRFALITGRYQYRLRAGLEEPIGPRPELGLPPEHPTLPSLLGKAGYATALLGKWHLGLPPGFGPRKSGYQTFFGNHSGAIDYFTHRRGVGFFAAPDLYEGDVPVDKAGYYTDLLSDRAVEYLEHRDRRSRPFLLSLHYTAPHWPWEGPGDKDVAVTDLFHNDGGSPAKYAEMVRALDAGVGRVLATLERTGLARNTVVVFTSDNGGERFSRNWPFSGQKTELLEGGIRVPAVVRWPGRIRPGQVSDQTAMSMDWLPTLLAAAGLRADPRFPSDGTSLLPVLTGEKPPVERTLFWRYKGLGQQAVRAGRTKYLRIAGNEFLFDVVADPRERANLAGRQPELLASLKKRFAAWNARMLPITDDVNSHTVDPADQADRYRVPEGG